MGCFSNVQTDARDLLIQLFGRKILEIQMTPLSLNVDQIRLNEQKEFQVTLREEGI